MSDKGDVRARLLRTVWHQIRALDESNVGNYPAARRAVANGAAPADLVRAMRYASYDLRSDCSSPSQPSMPNLGTTTPQRAGRC
jgi:hypothetical protein